MKRRGFTVIELLVVIGIIALLGALLVMGIGHMTRNQKANATTTDLANVRGFFDEMNSASRLTLTPNSWLWRNILPPNPPYTIPPNASPVAGPAVDFWKTPAQTADPRGVAFPTPIADCLDAEPGALTADNPVFRNGCRAVLNTQLAMRTILAFPVNKAAFARLPADRWMIPTWVNGSLLHPGIDGLLGTPDDPTDTMITVIYAVNNCVTDLDRSVTPPVMRTYRCIVENIPAGPNEPSIDVLTNPAHWVVDNNPTPVLLDAWNNPIIFVPASGLINVYGNVSVKVPVDLSSGYTVRADPSDTLAALPNEASRTPTGPTGGRYIPPIQSPDRRPFFVSAGPDGDLSTGDDNMYSFDK